MSKPALYPIKFYPIIKSPLWGGKKLASVLGKPIGDGIAGESWEISSVEDNISIVANGQLAGRSLVDLIRSYGGTLLGLQVYEKFGEEFPLLIKFIDANQDLSIQVHPNDELAHQRHNSFGKTEMWYIIEAEKDSTLISGFSKETNRQEYLDFFNSGKLLELLNQEKVEPDDVFFLPAGRVHTIGKGLLIAEIQQSSDITYRIYDFDRLDKDGNSRKLHTEEALDAIDFHHYDNYKTSYNKLSEYASVVNCPYFITNRILTEKPLLSDYRDIDSFKILMVLQGNGNIDTELGQYPYTRGDTYLIPACINSLTIHPTRQSKILEIYLPS